MQGLMLNIYTYLCLKLEIRKEQCSKYILFSQYVLPYTCIELGNLETQSKYAQLRLRIYLIMPDIIVPMHINIDCNLQVLFLYICVQKESISNPRSLQ